MNVPAESGFGPFRFHIHARSTSTLYILCASEANPVTSDIKLRSGTLRLRTISRWTDPSPAPNISLYTSVHFRSYSALHRRNSALLSMQFYVLPPRIRCPPACGSSLVPLCTPHCAEVAVLSFPLCPSFRRFRGAEQRAQQLASNSTRSSLTPNFPSITSPPGIIPECRSVLLSPLFQLPPPLRS